MQELHFASTTRQSPIAEPTAECWPKITLITPVHNGAHRLGETIRSVLSQNYPNLEYIIVDGGSKDGTLEVIRSCKDSLAFWMSEPDQGLYEALSKGFSHSTGEIMGWIGAGDRLHVGSLFVIGSVFHRFPEVEWITGIPTGFDERGMCTFFKKTPCWSRFRFLAGPYDQIQQESTFFKRSLWERSGGHLDIRRKSGADFELWLRFFRYAHLYRVRALLGGYTWHKDAGSVLRRAEDDRYRFQLVAQELELVWYGNLLKAIYRVQRLINYIPKVRGLWYYAVVRWISYLLYYLPGPDTAPTLEYFAGVGWSKRRW